MADDRDELQRLIIEALRLHRLSEQLALEFDDGLARVWREWERVLLDLMGDRRIMGPSAGLQLRAGQAVGLRGPMREALARAGYDATALGAMVSGTERWIAAVGVPVQSVESTVNALRRLLGSELLAQGDMAATALWRAMVQSVLTPRTRTELIRDLAPVLDRTLAQTATLFDTQMTIFGRQVEAMKTERLGEAQPFIFAGPVDARTREFCLERVGKVYSRAEIDQMDNEQLPNVMLTGGGYNCRHSWMAVESQALRDLSGTGQRAEGFDEDVARIRQIKARKKAA